MRLTGRNHRIDARESTHTDRKDRNYASKERTYQGFSRRLELPEEVDAGKISATCQDGVLSVTIPKAPPVRERRISIR